MGRKRADVRRCDDRKFRVGDELELAAWDPATETWLVDEPTIARITHVERMAGPLVIHGLRWVNSLAPDPDPVSLAVLSFELLG